MEIGLAIVAGLAVGFLVRDLLARARRGHAAGDAAAIDDRLDRVREGVDRLQDLVRRTGGEGQASFGEISAVLRGVDERTSALSNVLGNSRLRGQWGERAAEDILRASGFVEGVSFHKQRSMNGGHARPDFTFSLPRGLSVNMDAKFPLENYARAVEADGEAERERFERAFVHDVRERVKEIATRAYVDPGGATVDYVLLFIPSESVYAAIHRLDPGFVDAGLQQKVICCSPVTLFGVLAVIRKAVESFAVQQASDEVLTLMGRFTTEWRNYAEQFARLGSQLETARGTYDKLSVTRSRALEAPLRRIDALLRERGLEAAPPDGDGEEASFDGIAEGASSFDRPRMSGG